MLLFVITGLLHLSSGWICSFTSILMKWHDKKGKDEWLSRGRINGQIEKWKQCNWYENKEFDPMVGEWACVVQGSCLRSTLFYALWGAWRELVSFIYALKHLFLYLRSWKESCNSNWLIFNLSIRNIVNFFFLNVDLGWLCYPYIRHLTVLDSTAAKWDRWMNWTSRVPSYFKIPWPEFYWKSIQFYSIYLILNIITVKLFKLSLYTSGFSSDM